MQKELRSLSLLYQCAPVPCAVPVDILGKMLILNALLRQALVKEEN